jgi:hypothetical protein
VMRKARLLTHSFLTQAMLRYRRDPQGSRHDHQQPLNPCRLLDKE